MTNYRWKPERGTRLTVIDRATVNAGNKTAEMRAV